MCYYYIVTISCVQNSDMYKIRLRENLRFQTLDCFCPHIKPLLLRVQWQKQSLEIICCKLRKQSLNDLRHLYYAEARERQSLLYIYNMIISRRSSIPRIHVNWQSPLKLVVPR